MCSTGIDTIEFAVPATAPLIKYIDKGKSNLHYASYS